LGTTPEGCKPCDCDPGGAKNSTCDDVSGMCECKRKCDAVRPGYFSANLDHLKFEAEDTKRGEGVSFFNISLTLLNKKYNKFRR